MHLLNPELTFIFACVWSNENRCSVQPAGAYSDDTTTTTTTTTNTITTSGDLDVLNIETTLMPEMNWDRLEEQLRNALQLERCAEVCLQFFPSIMLSDFYLHCVPTTTTLYF